MRFMKQIILLCFASAGIGGMKLDGIGWINGVMTAHRSFNVGGELWINGVME